MRSVSAKRRGRASAEGRIEVRVENTRPKDLDLDAMVSKERRSGMDGED